MSRSQAVYLVVLIVSLGLAYPTQPSIASVPIPNAPCDCRGQGSSDYGIDNSDMYSDEDFRCEC